MEATTTRRRRTVQPITKAWNQAKKLDDSEKLQLITLLAESVKNAVAEPRKPRLYDPETGEYLNDETMKVIEDARKGIGVTSYDSVDDMFRSILGEKEFSKLRSSNV